MMLMKRNIHIIILSLTLVAIAVSFVDGFTTNHPSPKQSSHGTHQQRGATIAQYAVPEGLHWFVKTEQFCKPFPEVKPHLEAHREWVRSLRATDNTTQQQTTIVSGYRVDENDRPGGGGLMIFAAKDYTSAKEFVMNDPLVANGCVDWQLNKWIAETGDISIE